MTSAHFNTADDLRVVVECHVPEVCSAWLVADVSLDEPFDTATSEDGVSEQAGRESCLKDLNYRGGVGRSGLPCFQAEPVSVESVAGRRHRTLI